MAGRQLETPKYRGTLAALCAGLAMAIGLSGCVGGGGPAAQLRAKKADEAKLPITSTAVANAQIASTLTAGSVEVPEGAPRSALSLSRLGDVGLVLGDTALSRPPPDAVRNVEGVPVALLAPFSGRLEGPGQAILQGAQMAVFDVNNPELRLLPFDTGGTAAGAEQAARKALNQGARLIVGPLLADNVQAIRTSLETSQVPAIAFSNSSRVAGGPIYLAGFTPEAQIRAIVAHAAMEGRKQFAILAPDNEYGKVSVDALRAAATEFGVSFGPIGFYEPSTMDFSEQVQGISAYPDRVRALAEQRQLLTQQGDEAAKRALKRLEILDTWGDPPFDALVLPVLSAQTLRILSAQLSFYDVDQPAVQVLGLQRWDAFPGLQAEPGLIGSRYPAIRSSYRAGFAQRFEQLFGFAPSSLSSLAYDITAVAAALAGDGRRPPRYNEVTLKDQQGFIGSEGLFRFSEDGVAERGYSILEVSPAGVTEIQAAPANLDAPIFDPSRVPLVESEDGLVPGLEGAPPTQPAS